MRQEREQCPRWSYGHHVGIAVTFPLAPDMTYTSDEAVVSIGEQSACR
jgi:hypothetical protein